uniref:uncharacterized protein LOC120333224 n=1 Tax=Styela clava TaxID=7725 RepID=UPI00193A3D2A|nr:uncharacterized protein LOC120333224 [Styela clava]
MGSNINCRFKRGCNANQCDPSPWNQPGFSLEEYLERKAFPITCETGVYDDVLNLHAAVSDNRQLVEALENEMEQKIAETNRKIANINKQLESNDKANCPLRYLNHCFYVYLLKQSIDLKKAKLFCASRGAKAANVYSETHLSTLMKKIRLYVSTRSVYMWTGMKADSKTGVVMLRDGTPAPYVRWAKTKYPDAGETGVFILVNSDSSAKDQGMGTDPPTWALDGIICEI